MDTFRHFYHHFNQTNQQLRQFLIDFDPDFSFLAVQKFVKGTFFIKPLVGYATLNIHINWELCKVHLTQSLSN